VCYTSDHGPPIHNIHPNPAFPLFVFYEVTATVNSCAIIYFPPLRRSHRLILFYEQRLTSRLQLNADDDWAVLVLPSISAASVLALTAVQLSSAGRPINPIFSRSWLAPAVSFDAQLAMLHHELHITDAKCYFLGACVQSDVKSAVTRLALDRCCRA